MCINFELSIRTLFFFSFLHIKYLAPLAYWWREEGVWGYCPHSVPLSENEKKKKRKGKGKEKEEGENKGKARKEERTGRK